MTSFKKKAADAQKRGGSEKCHPPTRRRLRPGPIFVSPRRESIAFGKELRQFSSVMAVKSSSIRGRGR
jgi:hypothetical protein